MEEIINRALWKADPVKEGETGFTTAFTPDGMVYKIWYRTIGDYDNRLVRHELITIEQWEWEKAGCKNNEEWHRYLNRKMWADYSAGLRRPEEA